MNNDNVDYIDPTVEQMTDTWKQMAMCMTIPMFTTALNNIAWKSDPDGLRFGRTLICALNYKLADQFSHEADVSADFIERVRVSHVHNHCHGAEGRVHAWNEILKALHAYEGVETQIMHMYGMDGNKLLYRHASRKRDDVQYVIAVFASFLAEDRMARNAMRVQKDGGRKKSLRAQPMVDYYCTNGMITGNYDIEGEA